MCKVVIIYGTHSAMISTRMVKREKQKSVKLDLMANDPDNTIMIIQHANHKSKD